MTALRNLSAEPGIAPSANIPSGWTCEPFTQIADIAFSGVDKKSSPSEVPVRLCNYVDVFRNRRLHRGIAFSEATATTREISSFTLQAGDVVFTKDSETPEEIAEPAYVSEDLAGVVCGYHLAIARPKHGVDGFFLYYAMRETAVRRQFARVANGVTRFGLTLDALNEIRIPKPPIDEQRYIGATLSIWDETIERLLQQISRKQQLFISLREGLAHGTSRSNPRGASWAVVPLGSFLTMKNERVGNSGELPIYSITRDGMVPQDQHFNKRIANTDLSRHILVRPGDFALSGLNFWLGSVDVSTLSWPVCISPDYKVFKLGKNVVPTYLKHVVRTHRFIALLKGAAVERASIVRKNFDRETFLANELHVPPPDEQIRIAAVLDDADHEIAALKFQRIALIRQRDALASKLLTGSIRVPTALERDP